MSADARLKVVLYWHMHQPHYRDFVSGEYQLPWAYLHATKDYVDMAAHLEAEPKARAVVNFAPILLEQIDDYARQVQGFLQDTMAIRDPLLAALAQPALPVEAEQRMALVHACLRVNEKRLIDPFPFYRKLVDMAAWFRDRPEAIVYMSDQYLADLLVWYHLAWLGATVRRQDARVKALIEKGGGYTLHERRQLLGVIGELLAGIIGRYKALVQRGQVELSVTPYAHPIVPLLLDIKSAKEAMPDAPLPELTRYPGGEERARWHILRGIETFEHYFGFKPKGCWPSEGGVSTATLKLLAEYGFRWVATGSSVLHNSLSPVSGVKEGERTGEPMAVSECLHHPYALGKGAGKDKIACFFRDDGLSDMIGFTYSDWHADDAVANLVHHLENIATTCAGSGGVASIILDGENAWEYYPENGYYFLSALYRRLAEHPRFELTTFSGCLEAKVPVRTLPKLVAGSWVYGTFSTWIGSTDKNRGWDMLGDAKRAFDKAVSSGRLAGEQLALAERQLAVCEGSDWFWWFGDYNPAATVSDFERLFRLHLANLYQMMGVEPPEYLSHTFTHGGGAPQAGGVMRPGQAAP
ncbi:MAG: glycoside hydrolase [Gammaproteobacteria bacterium]|nr:glycoside hydrolase [Gammaproteobacteria bacterium]